MASRGSSWPRDWKCFLRLCRRPGFDPWVGKVPWRRKWQPTPVFMPGESHGPRSLLGYSPWGRKELDTTERLHFHFHLRLLHWQVSSFPVPPPGKPKTCGILVPWPGIEPGSLHWKCWVLTTRPPGTSLYSTRLSCLFFGPICYNIASVLCFVIFSLCLFFGHEACEILAPQPGIEPVLPAMEGKVLTTGPPGKSLFSS